jgi:hypothetical protein
MRPTLILAALALAALQGAPGVHAQTADQNGRCRGPDGKFATASACKGAGPAPAAKSVYRLDSKGRCRDDKGRMAKADKCAVVDGGPAPAAGPNEKPKP